MTNPLEQEVHRALGAFVAAIAAIAERAAIVAIRAAFAHASPHVRSHAVAADRSELLLAGDCRPRRVASAADTATELDRVVAFIRGNPGWSTSEIARQLRVHSARLRLHLRKLLASGTIRIEHRHPGGRKCRRYVALEHRSEVRDHESLALSHLAETQLSELSAISGRAIA